MLPAAPATPLATPLVPGSGTDTNERVSRIVINCLAGVIPLFFGISMGALAYNSWVDLIKIENLCGNGCEQDAFDAMKKEETTVILKTIVFSVLSIFGTAVGGYTIVKSFKCA